MMFKKKLGKEYILRFYITLKFHLSILLKLFINFNLATFCIYCYFVYFQSSGPIREKYICQSQFQPFL